MFAILNGVLYFYTLKSFLNMSLCKEIVSYWSLPRTFTHFYPLPRFADIYLQTLWALQGSENNNLTSEVCILGVVAVLGRMQKYSHSLGVIVTNLCYVPLCEDFLIYRKLKVSKCYVPLCEDFLIYRKLKVSKYLLFL